MSNTTQELFYSWGDSDHVVRFFWSFAFPEFVLYSPFCTSFFCVCVLGFFFFSLLYYFCRLEPFAPTHTSLHFCFTLLFAL